MICGSPRITGSWIPRAPTEGLWWHIHVDSPSPFLWVLCHPYLPSCDSGVVSQEHGQRQGKVLWVLLSETTRILRNQTSHLSSYAREENLCVVLLMKSHLLSYPCPLQINSFWNLGFLLGITIILQIITGILLGLYYSSDLYSAYFSIFFIIREIYFGWSLRYFHSSGASFIFLFIIIHLSRNLFYSSYYSFYLYSYFISSLSFF